MRESFGGAFIIKLLLIFIIIYVAFMAVAINYAKAFRVKNQVINMLEQYQYDGEEGIRDEIDEYLRNVPYNLRDNDSVRKYCNDASYGNKNDNYALTVQGVCIQTLGSDKKHYYRVTTFISIDFPFFDIQMTLPINGETKIIYT